MAIRNHMLSIIVNVIFLEAIKEMTIQCMKEYLVKLHYCKLIEIIFLHDKILVELYYNIALETIVVQTFENPPI